jgi:hypothetical protein
MIAQTSETARPARREIRIKNVKTGRVKTEHYGWSVPLGAIFTNIRELGPEWVFIHVDR